jgi:hypothetical protein
MSHLGEELAGQATDAGVPFRRAKATPDRSNAVVDPLKDFPELGGFDRREAEKLRRTTQLRISPRSGVLVGPAGDGYPGRAGYIHPDAHQHDLAYGNLPADCSALRWWSTWFW